MHSFRWSKYADGTIATRQDLTNEKVAMMKSLRAFARKQLKTQSAGEGAKPNGVEVAGTKTGQAGSSGELDLNTPVAKACIARIAEGVAAMNATVAQPQAAKKPRIGAKDDTAETKRRISTKQKGCAAAKEELHTSSDPEVEKPAPAPPAQSSGLQMPPPAAPRPQAAVRRLPSMGVSMYGFL